MRFGRNRPTRSSPYPKLSKYVNLSTLPSPPERPQSVDYSAAAIPAAGQGLQDVYGNDVLGNCTAAQFAHQINVWTGNSSACFLPTRDQVIAFYSACSGYVPGNPSTDRGADEITVLEIAKSVGLAGHPILTAVEVDARDEALVAASNWLLGGTSICIELPDPWPAIASSGPGFVWDEAPPNPNNGHCFLGYGYDRGGVPIDTWGNVSIQIPSHITWRALATLAVPSAGGSVFGMVSKDWLNALGSAPNGFDLEQLLFDATLIGGAV